MAYVALITAIIIATIGDVFMKKSEGFRIKKYGAVTIGLYVPTFYLMSLSMIAIPVGIAYATWSGVGMILTSIVGVMIFRENMNLKIVTALGFILAGVLTINLT
ncbi:DMT family transporter [Alkalicoccobacillus porphyridii]|uniref:QacE family quaternary ammonium compound efflux SMR transporter n=1 Tax=Alkalicoccobacillus porphyridii TaxID=2597270 RepID=A0A553ZWQ5_9BACI|nr:SMR family transporter [Alkalicoccobacillus porphyridii]TSB45873.1 QacE family quaternary ammonium compound efflux SMR transporter [Alkalicoccobacillus porphyridii]